MFWCKFRGEGAIPTLPKSDNIPTLSKSDNAHRPLPSTHTQTLQKTKSYFDDSVENCKVFQMFPKSGLVKIRQTCRLYIGRFVKCV